MNQINSLKQIIFTIEIVNKAKAHNFKIINQGNRIGIIYPDVGQEQAIEITNQEEWGEFCKEILKWI